MKSFFLALILLLLGLNACQVTSDNQHPEPPIGLPFTQESDFYQPVFTDTPSVPELNDSASHLPWLLIRDDTNPDQLLSLVDMSTLKLMPVEIPNGMTVTNLSQSVSPDTRKLILTNKLSDSQGNLALFTFNYLTGKIETELTLSHSELLDLPKIHASLSDEMEKLITERNYGLWMIKESAANSLTNFQWANDGNAIYFSRMDDDGFTYLYQYDLKAERNNKLESEPYFLETVKPSPDRTDILVTKSLLTQVPDFPAKSVFIITESNALIHLPYPKQKAGEIIDFHWFDAENILVSVFDSMEFSYISLGYFHLPDQRFHQLSTADFDEFTQINKNIILLKYDPQEDFTRLDIYELDTFEKSLLVDDNCSHVKPTPHPCCKLILTCKNNLYSLDNDLSLTPIQDVYGDLFFSPDNHLIISNPTNTPNGEQSRLKLLNTDFLLLREFTNYPSKQVVWQPGSQGFLYLTMKGLYYVSLPDGEPVLVYVSNTDDYRYLDMFWVVP